MFEKVNPNHPDKVADRIAGAIVDLAYTKSRNPKIAVEVLIGHSRAFIMAETSEKLEVLEVKRIVARIASIYDVIYIEVPQDSHLRANQADKLRCGDNGIFRGCPVTEEQDLLQEIAEGLYIKFVSDGKYIIDNKDLIICQSNIRYNETIEDWLSDQYDGTNLLSGIIEINPLGPWTGGLDVDCGATNRKLGSDMGDAVTGGGLHGKDLSKADVTLNIYCHLKAQELGEKVELCCAIGDDEVDGKPYSELVEIAREYIKRIGGFEKFAAWGLIRPYQKGIDYFDIFKSIKKNENS
jgi:S-adenosylmethionine synthetase